MQKLIQDLRFKVATIAATPDPQKLIYRALKQDYSEGNVSDASTFTKTESEYGSLIIKHLLKGGKGHFGPMEHPQITFNVVGFPHDVMVQARTHRTGISFDVQSSRYSGQRFIDAANGDKEIEDVFYARPIGYYRDREGNSEEYTRWMREEDLGLALQSCIQYRDRTQSGVPPEAARQFVVQGFRQNFVMSVNLRALLHFLDLRSKADAQPEIQAMSNLMIAEAQEWCPELIDWYSENRLHRAMFAP